MSKYADIEQIKEVIRTEWVKHMPMELDVSLSFVLGKISDVPTIDIVHCEECMWYNDCLQFVTSIDRTATALRWCSDGERRERIDNE